jgi:hypothetical protein
MGQKLPTPKIATDKFSWQLLKMEKELPDPEHYKGMQFQSNCC